MWGFPRTIPDMYIHPKVGKFLLRLAALGVLTFVGATAVVLTAPIWVRAIPAVDLNAPDGGDVVVLAADGTEIGRVATATNLVPLPAGDLPSTLTTVIVRNEDKRFYQHSGVDLRGTARAFLVIARGGSLQGGSTITQQLIRNETGIGMSRNLWRKAREAVLAWRLETQHDKQFILGRYMNTVWLGQGTRGVESASQAWYGIPSSELTLAQAAQIAASIPCPEACNPIAHPVAAEARRQLVLNTLLDNSAFSATAIRDARTAPVTLTASPRTTTGDRWVLDTVRRELKANGVAGFTGSDWGSGMTVRTTIDPVAQIAAVSAIRRALGDPAGQVSSLEAAAAFLDPSSGELRAIVGGRDFQNRQVNIALGTRGGGSGRQSGSTAKVFALLAGLGQGMSADTLIDAPSQVDVNGKPVTNHDSRNWGRIPLDLATRWSVNTAFINLTNTVGPLKVTEVARAFGVPAPLDGDARVTLGVVETDPLTIAAAYASLTNKGEWIQPHIVRSVTRDGKILFRTNVDKRQIVSESVAAQAVDILRGVVRNGTGSRATMFSGGSRVDVFGKTGTTDNGADTWFAGSTSSIAGAVWVGNALGNTAVSYIPGFGAAYGGGAPTQIWVDTIKAGLADSASPAIWAPELRKYYAPTKPSDSGDVASDASGDGSGDAVDDTGIELPIVNVEPNTEAPASSTPVVPTEPEPAVPVVSGN